MSDSRRRVKYREQSKKSESNLDRIIFSVIALSIILVLVIVFIVKDDDTDKIVESKELRTEITMQFDEIQEFEKIETHKFKLIDATGSEVALVNGNINLEDILVTLNNYVKNIDDRICAVGIVGSTVFIQTDTREKVDCEYSCNILSLQDGLKSDDWIELIETVNNECRVFADNLITYSTSTGNTHYMYIYSNTYGNTNISEETEIIAELGTNTENNV